MILGDSRYGFKYSITEQKVTYFLIFFCHTWLHEEYNAMLILNTCCNLMMQLCLHYLDFLSYVLFLESDEIFHLQWSILSECI